MMSQMREREKSEDYKEHYLEPKAREGSPSALCHALKFHALLGPPQTSNSQKVNMGSVPIIHSGPLDCLT